MTKLNDSNGKKTITDITGQRFGRLVVLEKSEKPEHYKNTGSWWKCKCDCGTIKNIPRSQLIREDCISCGCYNREKTAIMGKKNAFSDSSKSSFNALYQKYKASAKKKNLCFSIKKEDFLSLTKENCFYCGINPHAVITNTGCAGEYIYIGLDRIDSSKGYTRENIVPCCKNCNYAKRTMTQEEFKEWIKRVYKHFCS